MNQQGVQLACVQDLLQQEERSRTAEVESLRKLCDQLAADTDKCRVESKELCAATSSSEARKREEGVEEMRRLHAAHSEEQRKCFTLLVDQLSKDLRAEHDTQATERMRRCEEVAREVAEKVRVELVAEVSRVAKSGAEQLRLQEMAMNDDRARRDTEAQHTASEVRVCLQSHSDFMEAIEHEQQILINRLNEGLATEDQKRDGLSHRVQAVEFDMQKVRGHLPILFAVPTAFR
jgi:hypothetical protein